MEQKKDTQLQAEVLNKISLDAENLYNELDEKAREVDSYDFGLPMFRKIKKPITKLLTEYAIKLHQASALLKNVFTRYGEIHEWDREIFNDIKTFLDGTQHK